LIVECGYILSMFKTYDRALTLHAFAAKLFSADWNPSPECKMQIWFICDHVKEKATGIDQLQ